MKFRQLSTSLGRGKPQQRLFLIALTCTGLANPAFAQDAPKNLARSPAFTPSEVASLPAPPREGISIPTNGPVAEDLISIGAAAEISPNSDGQFGLAGIKAVVCEAPNVEAKLSGGTKRLRCVYLDAATIKRMKPEASVSAGGVIGQFTGSVGASADTFSRATDHRESLVVAIQIDTTRSFPGAALRYKTRTIESLNDVTNSTFASIHQLLGDGVIASHRIAKGVSIIVDLSDVTKETRRSIAGSFKAGIPGVFGASGGARRNEFQRYDKERVEVQAVSEGAELPSAITRLLPIDGEKIPLSTLPALVTSCLASLNDPALTDADARAVTLVSHLYVDGFPLRGNARFNYGKAAELRYQFISQQQAFENLKKMEKRMQLRGIEFTTRDYDSSLEPLAEKLNGTNSAFDNLFATPLSDDGAFQAAYQKARDELIDFNARASSFLKQTVNIILYANSEENDDPTLVNLLRRRYSKLESKSTFKLVLTNPTARFASDVRGHFEIGASSILKRDDPKENNERSIRPFSIDVKTLLNRFPNLPVRNLRALNVTQQTDNTIQLPEKPISDLGAGATYPDGDDSPLHVTLRVVERKRRISTGDAWDYFFYPKIDVALQFSAETTLEGLAAFCWNTI